MFGNGNNGTLSPDFIVISVVILARKEVGNPQSCHKGSKTFILFTSKQVFFLNVWEPFTQFEIVGRFVTLVVNMQFQVGTITFNTNFR